MIDVPVQTPLALHVSLYVHAVASSHAEPTFVIWHVDEQQSPFTVLPSSHCSPGSRMPLPHVFLHFPAGPASTMLWISDCARPRL